MTEDDRSKAYDYVAEHIFGYMQPQCQCRAGIAGASQETTLEEGFIALSKTGDWWICRWCGREYLADKSGQFQPGPGSPSFDIIALMRELGVRGIAIHLRYDPERAENNFTLIGPGGRISDTDAPLAALCEWVRGRK